MIKSSTYPVLAGRVFEHLVRISGFSLSVGGIERDVGWDVEVPCYETGRSNQAR